MMTDSFNPETCMVLINLIDFQYDWLSPFDPAKTEKRDFTLVDGKKVVVPLMRQQLRCRYYDDESVQCILLPYDNQDLAMLFVLPKDMNQWDETTNLFSQSTMARYQEEMILETVDCLIPKYEWHGTVDLKPVFEQLGVKSAFDREKADFSGIVDDNHLFVNQVIQNISFEIDESGTQATASTAAIFAPKSATGAATQVMNFHADRPFFFAVIDIKSNIYLFEGRCMNPESHNPHEEK